MIRQQSPELKKRLIFTFYALITIGAGLLSRTSLLPQHSFLGLYSGDTLYSLFVTLGFCILFPGRPVIRIFCYSIFFSFAIELLQLYHAPWIDTLRSYRIGGLILGFGFKWSDLLCYICGAMVGVTIYYLHFRTDPE